MYKYLVMSSTSKHATPFSRLPDKIIFHEAYPNFLISQHEILENTILEYNDNETIFVIDTEKKQGLSLYDAAEIENKIDYKPNDLTMEAADLAILNFFNGKINGKKIGVYGTGNIAFKLALRLSERNAHVYIFGRNANKITICIEALKQVTFDAELIHTGDLTSSLDCLVSFVSADEVITSEFSNLLNKNSLCLDGGIGNFTKEFISSALKGGNDVRRLDVRQSQEIMDGYINSRLNSKFSQIIGRDTINNYSVVAGGIMGNEGQIIVDRIINPTQVIGIANGIGGVKYESYLNAEEHIKIRRVQEFIEQNS